MDSSDESSVDWEEVEDGGLNGSQEQSSYTVPSEGVVITIPGEGGTFNIKKDKKKFDVGEWIRKETNRNIKEVQVLKHKVSLLCLLSRGLRINNSLRSEDILAVALSTLPSQQAYPPKHLNLSYLERFLTWFRRTYKVNATDLDTEGQDFEESLKTQLLAKKCSDQESQVYIFNTILRSLGVDTRVVWSLQPIPLKPSLDNLLKPPKVEDEEKECANESKLSSDKPSTSQKKKQPKNSKAAKPRKKTPRTGTKKPSRKIISSDDSEEETSPVLKPEKKGRDFWTEVFLEEEERWVSVDLTTGKILCDVELEASATQPLCYVLGFDNTGRVREVTRRYAARWLTATQKLRIDIAWWDSSLKPFRGRKVARDREEDEYLDQQLISQPLPKSIQECKGHPLFALRRHLLKFEAIYPMESVPLGCIKNDPVYSRDCVKTLHTRELWSRKAKVVCMGETPYKIVKARPKYDRFSNQAIKDLPLELFGEWQVEDYVPPVAKDGKVPRNAYGNVELFLEKMLPKGTVYLQLPALGRVAKKLDIDCAPALTGFDYHMGGSHPVFDGFVVCEEHKEILLDAWNQEQDEQKKRDNEKRLKRIYGNWAKLLKGLLIRRKLETKYSHTFTKRKVEETETGEDPSTSSAGSKKRQKR